MKVPDILVSGNHKEIKSWRRQKSIERTLERRKDLLIKDFENSEYSDSSNFEDKKIATFDEVNEKSIYPDW